MKTKFYFLCLSLIIVSCNSDITEETTYYLDCMECLEMSRPVDSYNYPVYPGQEKWASFRSSDEMLNALQIPVSTLKKMSTQAIIQSIWEHPLPKGIFMIGNGIYQNDFDIYFKKNNAYLALEKRNDAGEALLYRYIFVKPFAQNSPCYESKLFELLISQSVFLSQLNINLQRKIVEIAFKNDTEIQHQSKWSNTARPMTWLLIGRAMLAANYAPFMEVVNANLALKAFLEGWLPLEESAVGVTKAQQGVNYMRYQEDDMIIKDIINFGKQFINK